MQHLYVVYEEVWKNTSARTYDAPVRPGERVERRDNESFAKISVGSPVNLPFSAL